MFRVEWWTQHGQRVRTQQTVDNVHEIVDTLPRSAHVRVIDERSNTVVAHSSL